MSLRNIRQFSIGGASFVPSQLISIFYWRVRFGTLMHTESSCVQRRVWVEGVHTYNLVVGS